MGILNSVVIFIDNQFKLNKVVTIGGLMDISHSNVLISNCSFMNNRASNDGGVIDSWRSSIVVDSSLFLSNVASQEGGAIATDDTNITLCHSRFENNTATYGGGIAADYSNITITDVHFINNKAHHHGGAVHTDKSTVAMVAVSFVNNSAINGGGLYIENKDRVVVITSTFHSNLARDRGGAIAVRWQSIISTNETNIYNNTAKWGTALSNCNGHAELPDLTSVIDPIYTHCTIYEGYSDGYDIDVISHMLDNCSSANVSLSQIVTDTILAAHEAFNTYFTTTIVPTDSEDSNLTVDVSTTMSYGDYSEAFTTYLTTSFVTEVSTEFLDQCLSSHSDTGYIVALVIVTVAFFILLVYITFNKISYVMQSQLKRASCDTKIDTIRKKEEKSAKGTEDESPIDEAVPIKLNSQL